MCMKPDFPNTLLKESDGFSKYVKLLINYRGRKLTHALLLFHRSLIIQARKMFVILHSALWDTLTREVQWQKTITGKKIVKVHKSECRWHVFMYWVSVTAVFEGSFPNFNLTCKENSVHYSLLVDMFRKEGVRVKR